MGGRKGGKEGRGREEQSNGEVKETGYRTPGRRHRKGQRSEEKGDGHPQEPRKKPQWATLGKRKPRKMTNTDKSPHTGEARGSDVEKRSRHGGSCGQQVAGML